MYYLLGEVKCPHCLLETRFLSEQKEKEETEEKLLLIGERVERIEQGVIEGEAMECDYCGKKVENYAIIENNLVHAFLNKIQFQEFKKGNLKIVQVEESKGIKEEQRQQLKQFQVSFKEDFSKHPYSKGKKFKIEEQVWKIKEVYKKENGIENEEERIEQEIVDEYWYKVEDGAQQQKWVVVSDRKGENAILSLEPPVLQKGEEAIDITDELFKIKLLYEDRAGLYTIKSYQHLKGVRTVIFETLLDQKEIVVDVLKPDFEESLRIAKEKMRF